MNRNNLFKLSALALVLGAFSVNLSAETPSGVGYKVAPNAVKAGDALTLECSGCKAKITTKVESVSGAPKVSVDDKGMNKTAFVCAGCGEKVKS